MGINNYKQIGKGCLKARFDVVVPQWQMTIKDCALFEKDHKQWIALPSRSYEGQDGSKKHFELVSFPREVKERFQTKCLEMLKPMQPAQAVLESDVPF